MSDRESSESAYFAAMMEGVDLANHDELEPAREAFERAVALAHTLDGGTGRASAEAALHLASCRADLGAFEEALAGIDHAIVTLEALPDVPRVVIGMAHYSRAGVYAALARVDEAAADLDASIALLEKSGDEHRALLDHAREMRRDIEAARMK